MKKIQVFIALVALTSLAFDATIRDAIVEKILALKAKEFLTGEFVARLIQKDGPLTMSDGVPFNDAYQRVRRHSYYTLFPEEAKYDDNRYHYLITVAVAKLKSELHKGSTLMDTYQSVRQEFVKAMASKSPGLKQALIISLDDGIQTFNKVSNPTYRRDFARWLEIEEEKSHPSNPKLNRLETLLAKHASAEEIVKANNRNEGEVVLPEPSRAFAAPRDPDVVKFAIRRYNENKALVPKYVAVMKLMKSDIESIPVEE